MEAEELVDDVGAVEEGERQVEADGGAAAEYGRGRWREDR